MRACAYARPRVAGGEHPRRKPGGETPATPTHEAALGMSE
eukprot:CAMPEP_0176331740 /NCGR_PEP_ID=MMETSP0121_2-20121125/76705_2 /TAXON_ID=160619 /ORGANISM="Kryptoperidinium foliaceum, Strain CCMP 1326" /LENGTH=39 /DNA_ID= /DNA_START= /DNA_END= /DNA_ORIENTATION=